MNIGKREQIVIGSISAILLIVVLHLLVFAPGAARFKEAKGARDAMATQISGLSTIQDSKILTDFETKTNDYLKKLEGGMTRLKMDEPACFIVPKLSEVKEKPGDAPLPPYVEATPTPAAVMGGPTPTPNPDDDRRKQRHKEVLEELLPQQLDLVMAEVTKLREATRGRGVQLSFLGNNQHGWNVPTQLPANMQTSLLWDQVKSIASRRASMDKMNKISTQYPQVMRLYMNDMQQLELNLFASEGLAKYGEFVPIIHRLCLASLILQKLNPATPVIVENEPLTREKLLHYLSIDLTLEPLEGLNENKYYFLYEALRNLNYLIEMAQKMGIKDITAVTLRGFGYVREMARLDDPPEVIFDPEKLIDDELDDKNALAAAAAASPGAIDPTVAGGAAGMAPGGMMADPFANGGMGGAYDPYGMGMLAGPTLNLTSTTPQTGDLGIAIPIRISFIAPNTNGFTYLYEVLRDKPMAEVHRLLLRSTSVYNPAIPLTVRPNPTSTDVEMTATLLFVPKLFNTMDTVRVLVEELKAKANGTTTTATLTPTPLPGQ